MERVYAEAKQLADEQLRNENDQNNVELEVRRERKELRRKIATDDELIVRFNDDMDDEEDDEDALLMHNDSHDIDMQDDDLYFVENESTFEVTKFEPRSPASGSQSYTVLDSGDVALSESVDYYDDENEMLMEEDSQHGESFNVVFARNCFELSP